MNQAALLLLKPGRTLWAEADASVLTNLFPACV